MNSDRKPNAAAGEREGATGRSVLVTGGSGYLASWAIVELLQRGYVVRTTIRDLSRESEVRAMLASQAGDTDRLSFFQANLLEDTGWAQASEAVDYVLHIASPMPVGEFRGTDLVRPALDGTRRVLQAARTAGARRVVLTSSAEAALPAKSSEAVADETIWTDVPPAPEHDYARAKTLAERDAWSFAASVDLELSTVLPCFMQGPVLGGDYSGSVNVIARLLSGAFPAIPRIGWDIVDVRDIVDLHIRAMTSPLAAGERFIGSGEFMWVKEIAAILRTNLGSQATKVPTRTVPNLVVRLGSLVNGDLKQIAHRLGVQQSVSSAKAERLLGWKARPASEAILDAAASLILRDLV